MQVPFIDLRTQYLALKEDIRARMDRVLEHGQFIMGPEIVELEKELSSFTGARFAITCANGTDAALMALMALDIGPGDEVILPAFSFIATAEVVLLAGATPVYVDILPESYNINPALLEGALSKKTKAIMPVSLYGQTADLNEINAFALEKGLHVIEDAAQSFGASYHGRRSCNLSLVGCTSFFPAKPLGAYGDAGAIFTNDEGLALKLRQIRVHGDESRYHHVRLGINGRMDSLQAAILLSKLTRYEWEMSQRDRVAQAYHKGLKPIEEKGYVLPLTGPSRSHVWAQYTVRTPQRSELQARLKEKGIPTAIHYPTAMPLQPGYKGKGRCLAIPESEKAAREVLSLPMYPDMNQEVQKYVIQTLLACH